MLASARVPNIYHFKDFAGSSHRILIRLIRSFLPDRRGRLLDLGAAGGELANAVRGQFESITGFEYNVDAIGDLRRHFDRAVVADLENVPSLPSGFRAVILADVLEHLTEPPRMLRLIRNAVAGDGYVFLSVPNVANIVVRLELLFGSFRYRDRGILDRTHLRFYTKSTLLEELEREGFEVVAVTASAVPLRLVLAGRIPSPLITMGELVLLPLTRMMKTLFGYQIIVVARRLG